MRGNARLALLCVFLLVSACDPSRGTDGFFASDKHDRPGDLNREDFRNMDTPRGEKKIKDNIERRVKDEVSVQQDAPPIPDVAEILAAPRPPKIHHSKLVSIAVTDDVAIRDVLFELSRLANIDIEIGTGIEGGINFRAQNKPFNEVVERISDLAGLRYSMKGGVLRIERDSPYIKNYPLDFLNMVRSSENTVRLNTDVLASAGMAAMGGGMMGGGAAGGAAGGGAMAGGAGGAGGAAGGAMGGQGFTSGTSASITASAESDLWTAMDASIGEILNYMPNSGSTATTEASGSVAAAPSGNSGYVINRQAGVISANATQRQHEMISEFLETLKRNVSAQVIIEAKIVEVTLNDDFRTGINWDAVLDRADLNVNFQPTTSISPSSGITFGLNGGTAGPRRGLEDVISITQQFGTTRTLSSPRLHAINNQQSVLTFAENRIFFTCNQTQAETVNAGLGVGAGVITGGAFQCQRGVVPIGIILSIMPSVNLESQEVTLNVRPTLSRQIDSVPDPGTAIAAASTDRVVENLIAEVPVVEVRELDSVMKIKNGGIMVIGGLLEDVASSNSGGIPGLSDVPWIGNAFKAREESSRKRELIIFIKATIVDAAGHHTPADKRIYDKFMNDHRPLGL